MPKTSTLIAIYQLSEIQVGDLLCYCDLSKDDTEWHLITAIVPSAHRNGRFVYRSIELRSGKPDVAIIGDPDEYIGYENWLRAPIQKENK